MYTFLFDRKSLALLVGGAAAAAALFFAAGVLVGLRINLPPAPVQTAEFKALSAFEGGLVGTATAAPASPPTELPAMEPEPAPAAATAASQDPPPEPVPPAAARVATAPQPAPRVEVPTEPPPALTRLSPDRAEPSPAPAEPTPAPSEMPAEARPAPRAVASGAEPPSPPGPGHGPYVQVGAFAVAENADKQLALLLSEGFRGYIAERRTRSGGTLHVVCFGHYPTLKAAFVDAQKYLAGGADREAVVRSPS